MCCHKKTRNCIIYIGVAKNRRMKTIRKVFGLYGMSDRCVIARIFYFGILIGLTVLFFTT